MTERPLKTRAALEVILFEERRFVGSLMFTTPEVTIGSEPGAMVRLADPEVAPCHALLCFDGECCWIEDCGSEGGTAVNGEVVATQAIEGMDEISIGRYRLRVTLHRADATPPPASSRPASGQPRRAPATLVRQPLPPPPPPQAPAPTAVAPAPARPSPVVPPPVSRFGLAPSAPAQAAPPVLAQPTFAAPASTGKAVALAPIPEVDDLATIEMAVLSDDEPMPAHAVPARLDHGHGHDDGHGHGHDDGHGHGHDHDDDDEDEATFEPSFSLLDGLCEARLTGDRNEHAVEVIRFRHGCVTKLRHLRGGERLRLPGLRKAVGRASRPGTFSFFGDDLPPNASITEAGQPVDEAQWRRRIDKKGRISLDPGTQVRFPLPGGEGVLVHLVPAAASVPQIPLRLKLSKLMLWIGGLSLIIHVVVFAIIGVTSLVRRDYISDTTKGRFARIALKEIELEPPAPPPAREKKKAKPEPSEHVPSDSMPKVAVTHIPRARTTAPAPQASVTAQKLLSALGGLSAPKTSMATAMSNLDAVAPVRGGGFKVSGAIGKLPGDSLRLASAGSGIGRLDTKSTNDVGKDLGRVLARGSTGQVRAQVTTKPNALKVEGHLDRGEIQRVINSHIHELQGCYERQLIVSPNLSGKVSFEWVIGTNGAVTSVKIKTSTLSSNEATSCMQAAIRRWQFPSPSGGSVTVIYPIALANGT